MSTSAPSSAAATVTLPCPACGRWNRIDAGRAGPRCGACKAAIRLDVPMHLDDASFDRVVNGSALPVLVDFYADWCMPCKMMAPAVDQLARETAGTALVAKLDTEAAPRTAARFRISGIPTVIVFRGGREAKRQSGAMPAAGLRALLTQP